MRRKRMWPARRDGGLGCRFCGGGFCHADLVLVLRAAALYRDERADCQSLVIASEAKQSSDLSASAVWIASSLCSSQ
jgi:hypothetical protein